MTLVWLPPDAPDDLAPLPGSLRLHRSANLPAEAAKVEVVVAAPGNLSAFRAGLPRLTGLRFVQTPSAGVDFLPALPEHVVLANASGVHDGPVSEWVLGVILAMEKRLPHYLSEQQAQRWDVGGNAAFAGGRAAGDLAEQTVLIVGMGSIGRAVAQRLAPFGTEVLGVARRARDGVAGVEALPQLLERADIVVLLAPATPQTQGIVDAGFLERMRPGALLVNAARGSLVDTGALLTALHDGRIRVALDVTDPEPLPDGHPLWSAPGCLITPHVAGSTDHWKGRAYRLIADQLRRYAAGEPLLNVRTSGY